MEEYDREGVSSGVSGDCCTERVGYLPCFVWVILGVIAVILETCGTIGSIVRGERCWYYFQFKFVIIYVVMDMMGKNFAILVVCLDLC